MASSLCAAAAAAHVFAERDGELQVDERHLRHVVAPGRREERLPQRRAERGRREPCGRRAPQHRHDVKHHPTMSTARRGQSCPLLCRPLQSSAQDAPVEMGGACVLELPGRWVLATQAEAYAWMRCRQACLSSSWIGEYLRPCTTHSTQSVARWSFCLAKLSNCAPSGSRGSSRAQEGSVHLEVPHRHRVCSSPAASAYGISSLGCMPWR